MTQESGAAGRAARRGGGGRPGDQGSRTDRLLGGAAEPAAARPAVERGETPGAVRRAALVVGLEAVLLLGGAVVLLVLTATSSALSRSNAVAMAVLVGLFGAALAAAALGLWRVSAWARGPVVALQLVLAALGWSAITADRPELGVPVLALVAAELYLLATPEARLAYFRAPGDQP